MDKDTQATISELCSYVHTIPRVGFPPEPLSCNIVVCRADVYPYTARLLQPAQSSAPTLGRPFGYTTHFLAPLATHSSRDEWRLQRERVPEPQSRMLPGTMKAVTKPQFGFHGCAGAAAGNSKTHWDTPAAVVVWLSVVVVVGGRMLDWWRGMDCRL